jgi:hypothetical protein
VHAVTSTFAASQFENSVKSNGRTVLVKEFERTLKGTIIVVTKAMFSAFGKTEENHDKFQSVHLRMAGPQPKHL